MMADYELEKPFRIDNGELDEISKQQCFVLGFELAQIDALLQSGEPFKKPVHADNRERIEQFCKAEGVKYRLDWLTDDWMNLTVSWLEP